MEKFVRCYTSFFLYISFVQNNYSALSVYPFVPWTNAKQLCRKLAKVFSSRLNENLLSVLTRIYSSCGLKGQTAQQLTHFDISIKDQFIMSIHRVRINAIFSRSFKVLVNIILISVAIPGTLQLTERATTVKKLQRNHVNTSPKVRTQQFQFELRLSMRYVK